MDKAKIDEFKPLLLSYEGRIGPNSFWQGIIVVTAVAVVLQILAALTGFLGIIFSLASLALLWPYFCLYAKRFHDTGRGAIWVLAVLGGMFVAAMVIWAILTPALAGDAYAAAVRGGGAAFGFAIRSMILQVIMMILVHGGAAFIVARLKGTEGENPYGQPPVDAASMNPLA